MVVSVAVSPTWCEDWGFERGTYTRWSCISGNYSGANSSQTCGNSTISIASSGLDPVLNAVGISLQRVPLGGGAYSAKLGDTLTGSMSYGIRRTFTVTKTELLYQYSVVFQNCVPGNLSIQPYFRVTLQDSAGSTVYSNAQPCDASTPGFLPAPSGLGYKPWTCNRIDLTPFLGQTMSLIVEASDCSLGGHYGYAYVDFPCDPVIADAGPDQYVCDYDIGDSVTLATPTVNPNYQYVWTGPNGNVVSTGPSVVVTPAGPACTMQTFTLTVTDTATGCSSQDTAAVGVLGDFSVTIVRSYVCNGTVLTAVPSSGCWGSDATFLWSWGQTTPSITLYPDWFQPIHFTVTVNSGCYTHSATETGDIRPHGT